MRLSQDEAVAVAKGEASIMFVCSGDAEGLEIVGRF